MTVNLIDLRSEVIRCFTTFYSVFILFAYSYLCYVEFSNCLLFLLLWNSSDPEGKFSFYAYIMTNKDLLYL